MEILKVEAQTLFQKIIIPLSSFFSVLYLYISIDIIFGCSIFELKSKKFLLFSLKIEKKIEIFYHFQLIINQKKVTKPLFLCTVYTIKSENIIKRTIKISKKRMHVSI